MHGVFFINVAYKPFLRRLGAMCDDSAPALESHELVKWSFITKKVFQSWANGVRISRRKSKYGVTSTHIPQGLTSIAVYKNLSCRQELQERGLIHENHR